MSTAAMPSAVQLVYSVIHTEYTVDDDHVVKEVHDILPLLRLLLFASVSLAVSSKSEPVIQSG